MKLGGKHLLVEVGDSPESVTEHGDDEDPPITGKGKVPNKGNDYALSEDQCEGLKKLCNGRQSCLEGIKCDGGYEVPKHGEPPYGAPKDGAPQDEAPQDGAPQEGAPQDGAPQDGAPQDAPQDGAQKDAPQDGASQGDGKKRQNEFRPVEHKKPQ